MNNSFPSAQLARCYRSGEQIYFRIGKARDTDGTITALMKQIPKEDRFFDAVHEEWQVSERYTHVLEALFGNFPTILRRQSGVYLPLGNSPHNLAAMSSYIGSVRTAAADSRQTARVLTGKGMSILGYLTVAAICLALWPWLADDNNNWLPSNVAAPATSVREASSRPLQTPALSVVATPPTPAIVPQPTPDAIVAIVSSPANLRAGPGTDYEIQGQLDAGERINVTGQIIVPGSFSWYRLDNGLWIYSQLVGGMSKAPPNINE